MRALRSAEGSNPSPSETEHRVTAPARLREALELREDDLPHVVRRSRRARELEGLGRASAPVQSVEPGSR
jgi:hypothetical protein